MIASPELVPSWYFIPGVSFFVYGEKINIYSSLDPIHKEFIEAGSDYIQAILPMAAALPIYKLYRNKTFRNYERIVRRMQSAGKYTPNPQGPSGIAVFFVLEKTISFSYVY